MPQVLSQDKVIRVVTRFAAAVALVIAFILPLGYALTAIQDKSDSLEFKARVKASALNGLIANSPDVWMFAENRMQGLLSREPVALDNEFVQVLDAKGQVLVKSGQMPQPPVLSKGYALMDAGEVVGSVEVMGSLRAMLWKTLLAAIIGIALGVIVFVILRVLPLRALGRATIALNEETQRAQAMLQSISDAVITTDAQGLVRQVNQAGLVTLQAQSQQQIIGRAMLELVAPEYREAYTLHHQRVMAGEALLLQYESLGLGGERHWLETNAVLLQTHGEKVHLAVARDITEQKRVDLELQAHRHHLENLVNDRTAELRVAAAAFDSQEAMLITDANRVILQVNRAFTNITGYTAQEVIGQSPSMFESDRHGADFHQARWDTLARTGGWQGEVWDRRQGGEIYPTWVTMSALKDADGTVTHYISAHHDITDRIKAEDEIRSLAFYDHLTSLPNRRLLVERLEQAIVQCGRSKKHIALLFIDLDNFKTLNDTRGHHIGDLLLQQVARRLESCVRQADTVARLGGDEFIVMLEDLSQDLLEALSQAERVGEKILESLNQTYLLANQNHKSTPSIGATLFADRQDTIEDLLKRADLAMYQAKAAGRNAIRFFNPEMQAEVTSRVTAETSLREAIEGQQFVLYYQAQVDHHLNLLGAEVLLRWLHPQRGLVPPMEFIPLAEETGLILPLGQWVLQAACAQLAVWATQAPMAHLTIAVNVSAKQFHQKNFVADLMSVLEATGANPERLKLELTESLLIKDVEDVIVKMVAIKACGVGFSLDDFGTGYSSLSYLKRLPFDQIKIDQSFVRDILVDPNDAAIARMILALADSMNISVLAEGVETQAQRAFLDGLGCQNFQGYLFGRPVALDAFECSMLESF